MKGITMMATCLGTLMGSLWIGILTSKKQFKDGFHNKMLELPSLMVNYVQNGMTMWQIIKMNDINCQTIDSLNIFLPYTNLFVFALINTAVIIKMTPTHCGNTN